MYLLSLNDEFVLIFCMTSVGNFLKASFVGANTMRGVTGSGREGNMADGRIHTK